MKKLVCLLLCSAVIMALFAGCNQNDAPENSAPVSESMVVGTEGEETYPIKTRYCVLRYPERWKEQVQVTIEEQGVYTVKFSADGVALFDLAFGGEDGYVLGTLKLDEGNVPVRITSYEVEPGSEQYETYCAMQMDVNVILNGLWMEYEFADGVLIEDVDDSVFGIETSVGTLYYPERWKDQVTVDVSDSAVKFSANGIQLFDLLFGDSEGYLLGTYNGTDIRVVSYDIEQGDLPEQEFHDLCAMQEDVNVVLQHLMEDTNFIIGR